MEMIRLAEGPEFDLIRRILQQTRHTNELVRVGPGDDCAVIGQLALSVDASVENVHFRRDWLDPEEIGWRATSSALSDLAAVAAEPIAVLISLALPERDAGRFAEDVSRGAIAAAEAVGASLAGGDVVKSELLMIDVVALGTTDSPALRSHAMIGDEVWVTGALGGAAAAVAAFSAGTALNEAARERYARPQPRTREALWLREHGALHALIDLSDGLYGDLHHIAAASNSAILVEQERVPIHREAGASYTLAVSGGEDYELAFTAPPGSLRSLERQFKEQFNLPLTRIGEVIVGSGVRVRMLDGTMQEVRAQGYQHFGDSTI